MEVNSKKLLVKAILKSPFGLEWSVQGLGMLRIYLAPEWRLHIWDSSLKIPEASPLHTHPWHLKSWILSGELRNWRYKESWVGRPYNKATIQCGENACVLSPIEKVFLKWNEIETYKEGSFYTQSKDEIHQSLPKDGTVTLVLRTLTGDREKADVYWEGDGPFVSAKPRPATREEIERVTQKALEGF